MDATTAETPPLEVERALHWALDILDQYDARLVDLGDPPERVSSAIHLAAKAKARGALGDYRRWCASHLPALMADKTRLDILDREARLEPLVLHDGRSDLPRGYRGLGLMPGHVRRDIREAIDQAFRARLAQGERTNG